MTKRKHQPDDGGAEDGKSIKKRKSQKPTPVEPEENHTAASGKKSKISANAANGGDDSGAINTTSKTPKQSKTAVPTDHSGKQSRPDSKANTEKKRSRKAEEKNKKDDDEEDEEEEPTSTNEVKDDGKTNGDDGDDSADTKPSQNKEDISPRNTPASASASDASSSSGTITVLYTFGRNSDHQCGCPNEGDTSDDNDDGNASDDETDERHIIAVPRLVLSERDVGGKRIVSVACGYRHAALLTEDGCVFTWGAGKTGSLGHGDKCNVRRPRLVQSLKKANIRIVQIACGQQHTVALSDTGRVYTWGSSSDGQCGNGASNGSPPVLVPTLVKDMQHKKVIQIDCGLNLTVVLTDAKEVYFWGQYFLYTETMSRPVEITRLSGLGVKMISCGFYHAAALTESGDVWTWGINNTNQLGIGLPIARKQNDSLWVPYKVNIDEAILLMNVERIQQRKKFTTPQQQKLMLRQKPKIVSIQCGGQQTAALSEAHDVFMWGSLHITNFGVENRFPGFPLYMNMLNKMDISKISLGSTHTIVASNDNVYTFGFGSDYTHSFKSGPEPVKFDCPGTVVDIDAGNYFSAVILQVPASSVPERKAAPPPTKKANKSVDSTNSNHSKTTAGSSSAPAQAPPQLKPQKQKQKAKPPKSAKQA